MKTYELIGYRPPLKNQKRLALAESIGIKPQKLLDEALDEAFDKLLQKKRAIIENALKPVAA